MKRRAMVCGAFAVITSMALAPVAAAQSSLVTFATTSTGTRTLTTTAAPIFPAQDLSVSGGNVVATTAASTTLTEVFATGSTWSVKAQMCGPNNYAVPTASDCTTYPNRLMRATGTTPFTADAIMGSTITLQRGTPSITGTPAGTAVAGSETNLGSQVTLLTSSDEVASTTYNGVYAVTTGLTVTNLTKTGTWKGYWIVTQTT